MSAWNSCVFTLLTNDTSVFHWHVVALALSIAVLILGWRGPWKESAGWLAAAIAGGAALLELIQAGRLIRYQHLQTPFEAASGNEWAALAILSVQTLLVCAGLLKARHRFRGLVPGTGIRRWILFAAIVVISGAALSRNVRAYGIELAFAALLHAVQLGNLVLFMWHLPAGAGERFGRAWKVLAGESRPVSGGLERPVLAAALAVVVLTAGLNWVVYERHPHVPDEVCYLLQARYFAEGRISLPPPPVPEAFELFLMDQTGGRWFSCFPPGWPMVLAAGMKTGVPWLVNPVLAGVCIVWSYLLIVRLYERRLARLTVLLLCTSPWFLFMAMSWMPHVLTLACALGGALAVRLAEGRIWWAAAAGAAVAMAALTRPYDGFLIGLLFCVWMLLRGGKRLAPRLGLLAASAAVCGSVVFPYNRLLTGSPLKFPVEDYFNRKFWPGANSIGFGPNYGMPWGIDALPGHSPLEAVINTVLNISSVNAELFGWAMGSLVLLAAGLAGGAFDRRDGAMLSVLAGIPLAFAPFWFSGGPDFGARYWFLILLPCTVLSARSFEWLGSVFSAAIPDAHGRLLAGVLVLCAFAILVYVPWRAMDKYHGYLRMVPDVRELAAEEKFGRSLVFIRGEEHPDYASAFVYNPLDLRAAAPVYVRDRSPEVAARVMQAFPDRPVWVLNGPSITGGRFEVVVRPRQTAGRGQELAP